MKVLEGIHGLLLTTLRPFQAYKNEVYLFPKQLVTLHFPALDEVLTVLVREYADYSGVKVDGPFKGATVRSSRECCRWQSHAGRE